MSFFKVVSFGISCNILSMPEKQTANAEKKPSIANILVPLFVLLKLQFLVGIQSMKLMIDDNM